MRNRHFGGGIGLFVRLGANDATTVPREFGDRVEVGDLQVVVSNASERSQAAHFGHGVRNRRRQVTDSFAVISSGVPLNGAE